MKWVGFFYILTLLNFAVADGFNYTSFSSSTVFYEESATRPQPETQIEKPENNEGRFD